MPDSPILHTRPTCVFGTRSRLACSLLAAAALLTLPSAAWPQCGGGGGGGGSAERFALMDQMKIRTDYDRSDNITRVRVGPVAESERAAGIGAVYECLGKNCAPMFVQLLFVLPEWETEQGDALEIVPTPGESPIRPAATRDTRRVERRRVEIAVATLTLDEFLAVAEAEAVSYRLGESGTFTRRQKQALSSLAERIRKASRG